MHIAKKAFFQNGLPSFLVCVFYQLRDVQKHVASGPTFGFLFWEAKMALEDQGAPISGRRCCLVLSVPVESAMEW